jgi:hypothetical protein
MEYITELKNMLNKYVVNFWQRTKCISMDKDNILDKLLRKLFLYERIEPI